ncbi:MAG: hypothetical protein ACRDYZ_13330, partial [Acidimicrobiales bacterium]
EGRHGLGRAGSLAEWLGSLPAAARAIVEAEAATWATDLWSAVEWGRLGPGVRVGGPEPLWSPAGSPATALRGRVDIRVDGGGGAFLTVLPGQPVPASRVELGLSALAAALSAPSALAAPSTPSARSAHAARSALAVPPALSAPAEAAGPWGAAAQPPGVPERVVGWWPECGRALMVPVDLPLLEETADAVGRAVTALRAR